MIGVKITALLIVLTVIAKYFIESILEVSYGCFYTESKDKE